MAATLLWNDDDTSSSTKPQENSLQDLFVFGYACKLFRDDEKAKFIDEGRHLIPWMGDEKLLIDRYDGRGHLFDLTKHDAELLKGRRVELTEEEQAIEAACDEERYLELVTDVQEKAMYEEEEWKRYYESLQEGYKAVGFSYEQPAASDTGQSAADAEEVDEPFVPPEELMVPAGILLPPTVKVHARIEKTAMFIAQHGIQMEIMIKTKQSRNPQFEFLSFENPLNAYYKHLVQIIKSGKYKPKQPEQPAKQEQDHGDQHYLHPSLSTTNLHTPLPPPPPPKKIELPKVNVHDTHYGQLITSLKKYSNHRVVKEEPTPEASAEQQPALPPFMAQPDYGGTTILDPLPLPAAHKHHHHHHAHHSSHAAHHSSYVAHHHHGRVKEEKTEPPPPGTEAARPLAQVQSASSVQQGCEERSSPGPQQIVPPPPDIQPIVDRMAMYVARNGVEFEFVVKCKKDPRFAFLETGHVHFQYYDFKKNMFLKEAELKKRLEAKQAEQERQKKEEEAAAAANRSISFSIKGRSKDPEAASGRMKRPLFDYDSSGEETDENAKRKDATSRSSTPDSVSLRAAAIASSATAMAAVAAADTRPSVSPDELEKRQAEERLKHKLAVAAREKLVSSNKEKQLQLERKKKAALFINLLRIVKDAPMPDETPKSETEVREAEAPPQVETKIPTPPSSVAVFDYNNRSGTPTRLDKASVGDILRRSRSRSPLDNRSRQRKKSLSPPSAYAVSHNRYSPPKRRSRSPRRGLVSARHASPLIRPCRVRRSSPVHSRQKRSGSPQKKMNKRSKSRSASPSSKLHKKKHKRSRSKTPKKKKKARSRSKERESFKHGKERTSDKYHDKRKEKEKKKEKDKKEKEKKDKHKSKDSKSKTDREKKNKEVKSSSNKVSTTFSEKRQCSAPFLPAVMKPEEEAEIINSSSADSSDSSDSEMNTPSNSVGRSYPASAEVGTNSKLHKSSTAVSSTVIITSESQTSVTENSSVECLG